VRREKLMNTIIIKLSAVAALLVVTSACTIKSDALSGKPSSGIAAAPAKEDLLKLKELARTRETTRRMAHRTKGALFEISKEAFTPGKRFLYGAIIGKTSLSNLPYGMSLGPAIVELTRDHSSIYFFLSHHRIIKDSDGSAHDLVEKFPIISETEKSVVIDPAGSSSRMNLFFGSAGIALKLDTSLVQDLKNEDGVYSWNFTGRYMLEKESELTKMLSLPPDPTISLHMFLRPHVEKAESDTFRYKKAMLPFQVFMAKTLYYDEKGEETKPTQYAIHWDTSRKIRFKLSNSVPKEYRSHVAAGLLEWNKAFGAPVIEVDDKGTDAKMTSATETVVFWDPEHKTANKLAMAQIVNDPVTGEILKSGIYIGGGLLIKQLDALFIKKIQTRPDEDQNDKQPATTTEKTKKQLEKIMLAAMQDAHQPKHHMNIRFGGLGMSGAACMFPDLPGFSHANHAGHTHPGDKEPENDKPEKPESDYTPDPEEAKLVKEYEEFVGSYIKFTVMHEVGHALGLRHNFKGSLSIKGEEKSTTVMDYVVPDSHNLTLGQYDLDAIKNLYISKTEEPPTADYLTCTDEHANGSKSDPECNRFDTGDPLEFYSKILSSTMQSLETKFDLLTALDSLSTAAGAIEILSRYFRPDAIYKNPAKKLEARNLFASYMDKAAIEKASDPKLLKFHNWARKFAKTAIAKSVNKRLSEVSYVPEGTEKLLFEDYERWISDNSNIMPIEARRIMVGSLTLPAVLNGGRLMSFKTLENLREEIKDRINTLEKADPDTDEAHYDNSLRIIEERNLLKLINQAMTAY